MSLAYVAVAAFVIDIGIQGYNMYQAKEAGDDREDALRAETAHKKQLQQEKTDQLMATARARAAASGTSGVSENVFLEDLLRSSRDELDWLTTVGEFGIQAVENETDLALLEGAGNIVSNIGSVAAAGSKLSWGNTTPSLDSWEIDNGTITNF